MSAPESTSDQPIVHAGVADVLRAMSACMVPGRSDAMQVGAVRLLPHQIRAVERLPGIIARFGGAMLCDAVGVGKFCRQLVHVSSIARKHWTSQAAGFRTQLREVRVVAVIQSFSLHISQWCQNRRAIARRTDQSEQRCVE